MSGDSQLPAPARGESWTHQLAGIAETEQGRRTQDTVSGGRRAGCYVNSASTPRREAKVCFRGALFLIIIIIVNIIECC